MPGVQLISLQKGPGVEQLAAVSEQMRIENLAPELDAAGAFVDTAAVLQGLDLMITSDTAIAHVAGAAGVPTWLALSDHPDWRRFLGLDGSPWYPSMRLFRQNRPGDWTELFARMAEELRRIVEQPR